jgi:glycosyltransferase involved in cell wall biosynthesis
MFADFDNIKFRYIDRQETFSGKVRQAGLELAKGDIICYLDHDDMFGKDHLAIINEHFDTDKYLWVYYDDLLVKSEDHTIIEVRDVKPVQNFIGTSSIAHRRDANVVWGDEYGHDMDMIKTYLRPFPHIKIPTPQYYVCHCSGLNMDF